MLLLTPGHLTDTLTVGTVISSSNQAENLNSQIMSIGNVLIKIIKSMVVIMASHVLKKEF